MVLMKLRYPHFTGRNDSERIREMESYLKYLVDVLNFLLK